MEKVTLQRLIEDYFESPFRQITISAGEVVLKQAGYNDRLYWVKSGELEGFFAETAKDKKTKVFTAPAGTFIGVHSFFAETLEASTTVIAKEKSELAWIDTSTLVVSPEKYGPLTAQFTPVIVKELARRQRRASMEAVEREVVQKKLNTAEQMTTLGQLAAGIAHELNNAVGVINSKTERLQSVIIELLEECHPDASQFLEHGLLYGQKVSSSEVRVRTKELVSAYRLDRDTARKLARAVPQGEIDSSWFNNIEQALCYWEIGRDLHDMRLASKHSVGIVKSVKQLGRTDTDTEEWLDINDSINKALALLHNSLRGINVKISPAVLPKVKASSTELVQIWVNIIKNASDALSHTSEPAIEISTRHVRNMVQITVANNGPEINEATRRKIFQPNFTTKKGGLSFGLGLGLSIVQRIINSYGGSIAVMSNDEKTIFRIKLPVPVQDSEGSDGKN